MTTHSIGCRDCLQTFRGHDKRRRCRINGRIARLHERADILCDSFLPDVEKALKKALKKALVGGVK